MRRLLFQKAIFKRFATIDPFGGISLPEPPANPKRLNNKVAYITGGAGGVGRATAELFGRSGAKGIVITDIHEEQGKLLAQKINDENNRNVCTFIKCDMRNQEQIKSSIEQTVQLYGGLNIMFNNAGVMLPPDDNPTNTEDDVWDLTMLINVKSIFWGLKYGIPEIIKSGGGSIINTASFVALIGAATPQIAYTTSKGAVLSMSKEIAAIYAKQGIRCNALCPGPLRTPMLMEFLSDEEKLNRRLVHIPMGRFGEAREIAQAACFLASDESSYINGATFVVDGGVSSTYTTAL